MVQKFVRGLFLSKLHKVNYVVCYSMKYHSHAIDGLLVASILTACTLAVGFEPLVFPVVFFFSLFPDLDTDSIPRRWSYRVVFICLIYLGYFEFYKEAYFLSIIAITPLLDKHRGWTHKIWAPILFLVGLTVFYNNFIQNSDFMLYWKLYIATIIGWYVHLWVDRKK